MKLNPNTMAEQILEKSDKYIKTMSKDIIILNENQRSFMKNQQVMIDHLDKRLNDIENILEDIEQALNDIKNKR